MYVVCDSDREINDAFEDVSEEINIKASDDIRTRKEVEEMIKVGASRLGTSSGPQIVEEYD